MNVCQKSPSWMLTLLFFFLLFIAACTQEKQNNPVETQSQTENSSPTNAKADVPITKANIKWQANYNLQIDSIGNSYIPNAIKIDAQGNFVSGREAIVNRLKEEKSQSNSIQDRSTKFLTSAGRDQYTYEIASYTTEREQKYMEIVVWNMSEKKRELELAVKVEEGAKANEEIDKARDRWMELCNAHDAEKLVNEMYAENALYYNHKPILQGRPAITEDYSYMNRPEYTLKLAPLANYFVTSMLVFEIGQCSGSYGGKYLIVWQRNDSGKWEVLLDSNV